MTPEHLFSFTPSLMSAKTLEELFVQREPLAQRLGDLIRDSALTANKHHTLLIGPRGMGKTHLVALVYHRVKAQPDLTESLRIAWMQEEEWGVDSFLDLLLRICRALQAEYPQTFPADQVEALYSQSSAAAELLAARLLMEFVGSRSLLLLVENLDDLFKGLGETGQRRWRAFLQETSFTTVLATSQTLFNGVSRQTAPFYGFFRTLALDEFSVDDATQLLEKIAQHKADTALAEYLETPAGRARVRAVNHLAGGNPRVYVIFSDFLTRDSLDALVDPFLAMLDALTPYYQARLTYLSTQQRKIVEFLCDRGGAATVKEIARRCFITSQTASSQLKDLKEKGYVIADPLGPTGRDTYYELREPLMRLSLEAKKSRSGPIRLLIEFLRLWYPVPELRHQLDLCRPDTPIEREYLTRALEIAETSPDPRVAQCLKDYHASFDQNRFDDALKVAEELVTLEPDAFSYLRCGMCLIMLGEPEKAITYIDQSLERDAANAFAWYFMGSALFGLSRYGEAVMAYQKSIEIDDRNAFSWGGLAHLHNTQGNLKEAVQCWRKAAQINPREIFWLKGLEGSLYARRNYKGALAACNRALKIEPMDSETWSRKARTLLVLGRIDEALSAGDEAIKCDAKFGPGWYEKGNVLSRLRRYAEAVICFDKACELGVGGCCINSDRAEALIAVNDFARAIESLGRAFAQYDINQNHLVAHTVPIVRNVFQNTASSEQWTEQVQTLVQLYAEHDAGEALALALAETVLETVSPLVSRPLAELWHMAWRAAAADRPEFALPLRLMDTAIRYRETQDKRVLLELPMEERKILDALLNPPQETIVSEGQSDEH